MNLYRKVTENVSEFLDGMNREFMTTKFARYCGFSAVIFASLCIIIVSGIIYGCMVNDAMRGLAHGAIQLMVFIPSLVYALLEMDREINEKQFQRFGSILLTNTMFACAILSLSIALILTLTAIMEVSVPAFLFSAALVVSAGLGAWLQSSGKESAS